MTQERILDRLAKIKAMADGAKAIGSEAEAQAFAEMLQQMLNQHHLQMTDIEFANMEKEEPVDRHDIDYSKYPDIPVKAARILWVERLASMVARANYCRILVHRHSSRITLVGRKHEVEIAEYLFITLQRAAIVLRRAAQRAYASDCRRQRIHPEPNFRESFMQAFLTRLMDRLEAERKSFAESSSTALVRVNTSERAVEKYLRDIGTRSAGRLRFRATGNDEGARRGHSAADAVNLKANAIKGGRNQQMLE